MTRSIYPKASCKPFLFSGTLKKKKLVTIYLSIGVIIFHYKILRPKFDDLGGWGGRKKKRKERKKENKQMDEPRFSVGASSRLVCVRREEENTVLVSVDGMSGE